MQMLCCAKTPCWTLAQHFRAKTQCRASALHFRATNAVSDLGTAFSCEIAVSNLSTAFSRENAVSDLSTAFSRENAVLDLSTTISRKNTASRVCKVTLKTWENLENIKNQKISLEKAKNLKKRPNFALFEVFLRFQPRIIPSSVLSFRPYFN